jgi:long-chain acyl-CoA synthetase
VLPQELTIEAGDVTPTLKLRRASVAARYAEDVELLYS